METAASSDNPTPDTNREESNSPSSSLAPSETSSLATSAGVLVGIQTPAIVLFATALLVSAILFFAAPSIINASRFPLPDDVLGLIGRPGLKPEESEKLAAAVKSSLAVPPRTFFPICAAILVSLFALVEGLYWKKAGVVLWSLIVGPVIGVGIGFAIAELTMYFFFASGSSANPDLTEALAMQSISLGLFGSGAGLAIGITARNLLTAVIGCASGILSGLVASCLFVIGTSLLFPTQDVFYPIPGPRLESIADTGTIALWAIALPLCLGIALGAARKKTK